MTLMCLKRLEAGAVPSEWLLPCIRLEMSVTDGGGEGDFQGRTGLDVNLLLLASEAGEEEDD